VNFFTREGELFQPGGGTSYRNVEDVQKGHFAVVSGKSHLIISMLQMANLLKRGFLDTLYVVVRVRYG
jgi:hypothetical protein